MSVASWSYHILRYNRTYIELKLKEFSQIPQFWQCYNRTYIELKYAIERIDQTITSVIIVLI